MKILYIGHYNEGSGWSKAAIDYILALDSIGIDVVCRNIKLTPNYFDIPEKIKELESKPLTGIDYCVQHVLPHHLVGTKKFKKNIAFFVTESNTTKNTSWYQYLTQMDEVWVPNQTNKEVLLRDGIKKINVIPHTFDINKYSAQLNKLNLYSASNKFKFYYIGDLNDRKNIASIVKAYNSEFINGEDVCLVLKVKKHGVNPQVLHDSFMKFTDQIKSSLRIHKDNSFYPSEVIITADMGDSMINDLHNTCDCFVSPSHGEGWSIPAFEAMAYGKTPICSNEGGPKEFIDSKNKNTGTLINGIYSVCTYGDPAFLDTFTGKEEWFIPSESEIKKAMRFYYDNRNAIDRSHGKQQAEKFNYVNIAKLIKDTLENE
jgi:glycosyltransferase involved in cell wall biosynthesis